MFLHKMGIGLIGLMKPKRKKRLTSWFQSPQERGEAVCSQGSDQGPAPSWALGGHVPHRLTQETGPALSPAPQMRLGPRRLPSYAEGATATSGRSSTEPGRTCTHALFVKQDGALWTLSHPPVGSPNPRKTSTPLSCHALQPLFIPALSFSPVF